MLRVLLYLQFVHCTVLALEIRQLSHHGDQLVFRMIFPVSKQNELIIS